MLKRVKLLIIFLLIIPLLFLTYHFYLFYNSGDYKISDMWIGDNHKGGISYCDSCLWIEFDEGCNRRKVYYFENQHQYDDRLNIGDYVNIKFNKVNNINYIKYVTNAKKYYRSKC